MTWAGDLDIIAHTRTLFGLGLRPPRDWMPPVEWRPRRFNKRSDAICNLILDGADSFGYEGENAEVVVGLRPHFLLYSDGGCRGTGRSATGYVIYGYIFGYGDQVQYYTLALGGKGFDCDLSSFELEARALAQALAKLTSMLLLYGR